MVPKLQTKANWLEEAELKQEISIDISDDTVRYGVFKCNFVICCFLYNNDDIYNVLWVPSMRRCRLFHNL